MFSCRNTRLGLSYILQMVMRHLSLLLPLLLLLFVTPCFASKPPLLLTGTDLLTACDGPYVNEFAELVSTMLCVGYIQGIQQFQHVITGMRKVDPLFCEPNKTGTYDQMRRVLVKWLQDNPEHLHRDARLVVTLAFRQAFPCK